MNTLLTQFKTNVDALRSEVLDFSVPNRSTVGAETVTVADMMNPQIARGNCWVTANEIYENADFEQYGSVDGIDIVGVETEGLTHYAVYLSKDGEEIALDFTARQFSPDAPFPMIMPVAMWHAYMKHVTGNESLQLVLND